MTPTSGWSRDGPSECAKSPSLATELLPNSLYPTLPMRCGDRRPRPSAGREPPPDGKPSLVISLLEVARTGCIHPLVKLAQPYCGEVPASWLSVPARGTAPARRLTHARILLKADQGEGGPGWSDVAIAGPFPYAVRHAGDCSDCTGRADA